MICVGVSPLLGEVGRLGFLLGHVTMVGRDLLSLGTFVLLRCSRGAAPQTPQPATNAFGAMME